MTTADSVKAKIRNIISKANGATGRTDDNVDSAVNALISGFGQGGGITPTGTKIITENGEYDVSTFEKVQVAVPVPSGYIKPSGSVDIVQNGTVDVTNYATAEVNVSTPTEKTVIRTITLESDITGTNALVTHLSNDDFIKQHYADEGFSVMLTRSAPVASETNVLHSIYQGNKNIGSNNVSRTGFMYRSISASAIGMVTCTTAINGKGYGSQLRAASDGSLKQYLATGNILKAGTYFIVLTCTT